MIVHLLREADPARLSQRLNPCRDVDTVAIDIAAPVDHVTQVNADLELDPARRGGDCVPLGEGALNLNGTLRRLERAVELDQERIADGLDLGAVETWKDRAQQTTVFLEQFKG